jgi:NAD(P)-dependent dehydrogenase (short-subunit alcohol dehydrogenase family)
VIVWDDSGVAELVAQKMRAMGYHAQTVALPVADEAMVEQMFTEIIAKTGQPLAGFIYIASLKDCSDGLLFSKMEINALKAVFLCAKYFARLFKGGAKRGFFVSAARIDGQLGLGAGGSAVQGGLFGLHKSLQLEWREIILSKAVDLAPKLPKDRAADYLIDEIFNTNCKSLEIGRPLDGKRYAPYLTENYPTPDLLDKGPERGDVLLITGGGRGITAKCAIRLAQSFQCGLILLGRTDISADLEWTGGARDRARLRELAIAKLKPARPKPSEIEKLVDSALNQIEVQDNLGAIRAAGGRAHYESCDVQNLEQLKNTVEACEAKLGPITGLVHGAGIIADKKIQRKTAADFDSVFGAKIIGLDACLRCISAKRLKYLILFSSTAGYFGNDGQSDYAMANEVLNKFTFTFKKEHPNCKAVSLNWGMWDGGSMVSESIRNSVKNSKTRLIPLEIGTNYFIEQFAYAQKPGVCQILISSFA